MAEDALSTAMANIAITVDRNCKNWQATPTATTNPPSPLYCTAAGKVFLASLSVEELEHYLRDEKLEPLTANTITKAAALRKEVKEAAASDIALDRSEWSDDAFCVAGPVRNYANAVVAAIGITGPTWRVRQKDLAALTRQVKDVAADLSRVLGYR